MIVEERDMAVEAPVEETFGDAGRPLSERLDAIIGILIESSESVKALEQSLVEERGRCSRLTFALDQVSQENAVLWARVRELEVPWWRRLFRPRLNAFLP